MLRYPNLPPAPSVRNPIDEGGEGMVPAAHGQVAVSFTYRGLSNGAPDVEIGMAQVVSGKPTYHSLAVWDR
jgi:hypothetical protein